MKTQELYYFTKEEIDPFNFGARRLNLPEDSPKKGKIVNGDKNQGT